MWGTWWVWDARLTSVAILFLIYMIIIFLNNSLENREVREKIVAIFVIIGSINLPIINLAALISSRDYAVLSDLTQTLRYSSDERHDIQTEMELALQEFEDDISRDDDDDDGGGFLATLLDKLAKAQQPDAPPGGPGGAAQADADAAVAAQA